MGPRFEDGVLDVEAPAISGAGYGPRFDDGVLPLWEGPKESASEEKPDWKDKFLADDFDMGGWLLEQKRNRTQARMKESGHFSHLPDDWIQQYVEGDIETQSKLAPYARLAASYANDRVAQEGEEYLYGLPGAGYLEEAAQLAARRDRAKEGSKEWEEASRALQLHNAILPNKMAQAQIMQGHVAEQGFRTSDLLADIYQREADVEAAEDDFVTNLPVVIRNATRGFHEATAKTGEAVLLGLETLLPGENPNIKQAKEGIRSDLNRERRLGAIKNEQRSYIGGIADDTANSIAEFAAVNASTGGTGVLPYLFATSSREGYLQAKEAGLEENAAIANGVAKGALETVITHYTGKVLGGGLETPGARGLIGQQVSRALADSRPAVRKLTEVAMQGGSETVEELLVELSATAVDASSGVSTEGLGERLLRTGLGGFLGGTGSSSLHNAVNQVDTSIRKAVSQAQEAAQAIQDAQTYEGDTPPRTDRRGFAKDTATPPVPEGYIRFYHGGVTPDGGNRWLTPQRERAEDAYTDDNRQLYYVDVPVGHPELVDLDPDGYLNEVDAKNPVVKWGNFEASEELSSQLRPYSTGKAKTTKTYRDTFVDAVEAKQSEGVREVLNDIADKMDRGEELSPIENDIVHGNASEMKRVLKEREDATTPQVEPQVDTPSAEPMVSASVIAPPISSLNELPKYGRMVGRWLKKNFGERGGILGKDIDTAREVQVGQVAKHAKQARHNEADLKKALRNNGLSTPLGTIEDSVRVAMDDVLKGGEPDARLPADVVAPLKVMRDHVDALSRQLLDSGAIEEGSELEVTIDENMGFYINRTYRKHHRNNWVQEVRENPELWQTGMDYLREDYPDATNEELEARLEILLSHRPGSEIPPSLRADRKFMGILKKRKDLDDTLRQLYGEYRDPFVNYVHTVSKLATLVSSHQMGESMRQIGLETGLFTTDDNLQPGKYAQIDGETVPMLRGLHGLYTAPEIKAELERTFNPQALHKILRLYLTGVGYSKASKTVLAVPRGAIRNFLGNMLIAMQAGNNPFGGYRELARSWNAKKRNPKEARAFVERMAELGVIEDNWRFAEVRDILDRADQLDPMQEDDRAFVRAAKRGYRKLADLYQHADTVWKIDAFIKYQKQYAKAHPDMTSQEVDRLAADRVRDLYPTYSRAKPIAKVISRVPLTGDFALFTAEMMRTYANALKIGSSEVKTGLETGSQALVVAGSQKLAGAILAPMVMSAASKLSMLLSGISDDEDEDRRKFRPFWQRNAPILYLGHSEDGQPRQMDLGYMDPHQFINRPVIAMSRDMPFQQRVWEAWNELHRPFSERSMLTGALMEAAVGYTEEGRPIYSGAATEQEKTEAIFKHIAEPLVPSVMQSGERIRKAAKGEVNPYTGKQYNVWEESIAAILGRSSSQNIPTSFEYSGRANRARLNEASADVLAAIRQPNNYTPEELVEHYIQRDTVRRQVWQEWHDTYHAAVRLGVPEDEANNILEATAGKRNAKNIIAGKYEPYWPSRNVLRDLNKKYPERMQALEEAKNSL